MVFIRVAEFCSLPYLCETKFQNFAAHKIYSAVQNSAMQNLRLRNYEIPRYVFMRRSSAIFYDACATMRVFACKWSKPCISRTQTQVPRKNRKNRSGLPFYP